ncbi:para-aminobenzoate synthetase [Brevibacterium sanguinis]|uniref:aminodeoxychorismate synthase n=2 Tax=Brevibacterium TaxID=1696 RepID=A0A366INW6_9MICO|nr:MULTISPECIES: aminodeoxychorismate synthase component I [Brevibacterium]RBP67820.1 para-aminobenzoate synthetase [Brevibacterium sanguinis]RBP74763.1 para-aminobenzoate synthetase [Brevibacterium celere]
MGDTPLRTLLIDNYDSFTFNLFHYLAEVNGCEPVIVPNDWAEWDLKVLESFDNVVISPGPGAPDRGEDFGICAEVLDRAEIPVLGICLGHQGLAISGGGAVGHAPAPMHGRVSAVEHTGEDLFGGLPSPLNVVRYHSLTVTEVPAGLDVTARTVDGVVMGLRHRSRPQWGVQFHPESISTEHGLELVRNFARLTRAWQVERGVTPVLRRTEPPDALEADERTSVVPQRAAAKRHFVLHARQLAMSRSSEALFSALFAGDSTAVWLDGNLPGHASSRFSIMGAPTGPLSRIVRADVATGTVTVTSAAGTETITSGFFDWLDADLASTELTLAEATPKLPFEFRLGWVGYLGYELKAEVGSPLRHVSDSPDALMMFLDRALVIDHETGTVHLLALAGDGVSEADCRTWFDEVGAVIATGDESLAAQSRVQPMGDRLPAGQVSSDHSAHELTVRHPRAEYLDRIERAQQLITDGETYEVCLTTMLETPWACDPLTTYRRLRRDNPTPFGAFLTSPEVSVLSTSPERFLSVSAGGHCESKPIKGTRPRGATQAEDEALIGDMVSSEKDRSENLMIVDLVRHDLGRTAQLGSVQVDKLFGIESYATVHQLVSTVSSQLDVRSTPVDCIRAAFPPGSMTGAPKLRTMSIIDELEDGPRGAYSGAIGYFSLNGAVDLSVLIRTSVIADGALRYGVGGAIVALSDPVEEYVETVVKATPLLRLLGDARFPGHVDQAAVLP